MTHHARWALIAVFLVLGLVASLYAVWRGVDPHTAAAASRDGIDGIAVLDSLPDQGFERPSGAWRLDLPRDHGAHAGTRSESWILSARLQSAGGESIGVQLALLRVALVPPDAARRASAWAAREVYRGHVVLASADDQRAVGEERFSRAVLGLAGHDPAARRIWIEDWSIRYGEGERGDRLSVTTRVNDRLLEMVLTPDKSTAVTNEADGRAPFRRVALTRLEVEGFMGTASGRQAVSGLAWLDHVWGEVPLPAGPVVWDRLQLQLDDGSELSLIRTRRRDGRGDASASGFRVKLEGEVEPLEAEATDMTPTRFWQRGRDGPGYPLYWRVRARDLELDVSPLIEDQAHDFSATLWSGLVTAQGSSRGRPVSGAGFLELTGYEKP